MALSLASAISLSWEQQKDASLEVSCSFPLQVERSYWFLLRSHTGSCIQEVVGQFRLQEGVAHFAGTVRSLHKQQ